MSRLEELYRLRTFVAAEILREEERAAAPTDAPAPVNSQLILNAAADLYGVTVEQILSGGRQVPIPRARQAVCWLLRANGLSLPVIGRVLDRHHTTVLHACNKIDGDPAVRALLWPLLGGVAA